MYIGHASFVRDIQKTYLIRSDYGVVSDKCTKPSCFEAPKNQKSLTFMINLPVSSVAPAGREADVAVLTDELCVYEGAPFESSE